MPCIWPQQKPCPWPVRHIKLTDALLVRRERKAPSCRPGVRGGAGWRGGGGQSFQCLAELHSGRLWLSHRPFCPSEARKEPCSLWGILRLLSQSLTFPIAPRCMRSSMLPIRLALVSSPRIKHGAWRRPPVNVWLCPVIWALPNPAPLGRPGTSSFAVSPMTGRKGGD